MRRRVACPCEKRCWRICRLSTGPLLQRLRPIRTGCSLFSLARSTRFPPARSAQRTIAAIRYVPNADCFFQGDDPLAIIRSVPELVALRVTEREPWATERLDPYQCNIIIEALSAASLDEVQRVFRFVSDQVTVIDADLNGVASADSGPTGNTYDRGIAFAPRRDVKDRCLGGRDRRTDCRKECLGASGGQNEGY